MKGKVKNKRNLIIGLLVIVIGAVAITSIIVYALRIRQPEYFHPWRRNLATKLYNEVMDLDLENDYPKTASDVMEVNNVINQLIYGDMLLNNELLGGLLKVQRGLYAEELLESISYDEQYENLVAGLEKYRDLGTRCFEISQETPQRSVDDENTTLINVVWKTNNMGNMAWLYTLIENDKGQYKILRFEITE